MDAHRLEASSTVESPVGELGLVARGGRLVRVGFGAVQPRGSSPVLEAASAQLREYFEGARRRFELRLAPPSEGLLGRVLSALAEVPYGATISYQQLTLAAGIDRQRVREVGAALGRNPLAIVMPCHRVIGSGGGLVGFGGGLDRKRLLLDLEAPQLQIVR